METHAIQNFFRKAGGYFTKPISALQLFSCEFCEIIQNSYSVEHLPKAGSDRYRQIEANLGPYRTSLMELFAKKLKAFGLLTISAESSIVDVWPSPKYVSDKGGKAAITYISSHHISCNTSSNLQNENDQKEDEELW